LVTLARTGKISIDHTQRNQSNGHTNVSTDENEESDRLVTRKKIEM